MVENFNSMISHPLRGEHENIVSVPITVAKISNSAAVVVQLLHESHFQDITGTVFYLMRLEGEERNNQIQFNCTKALENCKEKKYCSEYSY